MFQIQNHQKNLEPVGKTFSSFCLAWLWGASSLMLGCGFPDSGLSESERRLAEREKVIQSYRAIQGVYEGEIRTPERSMPAKVYLGYTEIQSGQDADGRPIFQPRLTGRLIRPMVLSNDVSMTGDFEPGAGVLTLTSAPRTGVGASEASEFFYLQARYFGESFFGELRVRDQLYGTLSVTRSSNQLPSNWELDQGGLSEREKKIAAFKKIQGVYLGKIDLGDRAIPARVVLGYVEVPNGFDTDGRPRFNVVLTLRLSRPTLLVSDVVLKGAFDPLTRLLTLADAAAAGTSGSSGNPGGAATTSGGASVGNPTSSGQLPEAFYLRASITEEEPFFLDGELRTKDQGYGRLQVRRETEQVPGVADLDELLFNQIYNLLKPLEGRYRAEHRTDKIEVMERFEIRVDTGANRLPSLIVHYRRNEFTSAVATALSFRPAFTPPRLAFTTSYVAGTGGTVIVSFDGELASNGEIRGILTHGNLSGDFVARKISGLKSAAP